jgi:predicted anti-sigma-YlaC factor YlaD
MSVEEKLKCSEVVRILSDGLDANMNPATRTRLQLHMVACTACRNVEQQFKLLRRLMRKDPPDEPPNIVR